MRFFHALIRDAHTPVTQPDSSCTSAGGARLFTLSFAPQLLLPAVLGALLVVASPQGASAQTPSPSTPETASNVETGSATDPSSAEPSDRIPSDLTDLLDALASSAEPDDADRLVRQIQRRWNNSGSSSVDLLMQRSALAIRQRNLPLALDLLDTVTVLAPNYAEGWNRRATVHFMREDYALSIADVQQVLRLEPRHFGALSGIGIMLDELGQYRQAAAFLEAALAVHPHLQNAKRRLDAIERRLEGAPI
ncbi:MAG: tetratricopeptide repeat protein [Devosiaceae bacterium]|nr:tetratricopeptide repeat protein [Devosiaceae bacterium MH13]